KPSAIVSPQSRERASPRKGKASSHGQLASPAAAASMAGV
ncbi:hypothetical protein OY671_007680, partial [Metschnikowia pulcherrima]